MKQGKNERQLNQQTCCTLLIFHFQQQAHKNLVNPHKSTQKHQSIQKHNTQKYSEHRTQMVDDECFQHIMADK